MKITQEQYVLAKKLLKLFKKKRGTLTYFAGWLEVTPSAVCHMMKVGHLPKRHVSNTKAYFEWRS